MAYSNKALQFRDLMYHALESKLCVNPFCTTCGALKFRNKLKNFTNEEIVEGLKILSSDFMHFEESIPCLKICTSLLIASGFEGNLKSLLEGTPVGMVLKEVINYTDEYDY